ncbi:MULTISPECIES: amino acid adenylation domain-containing protein [Actinosynnema]|uniref:amino acid adenylation domain-containing protein n=1 Tax=Actinosynnema TaxID=40566 RepID=UPI0020A4AF69|nr:amino acid adenylation domain-containing protein [Actinosynnema pretiosum]MCP2099804.1 amino acid adenylation domain-containing protein [Actinosynnema pretiosum]
MHQKITPGGRRTVPGRADPERPAPATDAQRALWLLERLHPGGSAHTVPVAVRLDGALDVPALRRALDLVVRRHEALRTTFAERDGVLRQVVAPAGPVALPITDLAGEPEPEAIAGRLLQEWADEPFDLAAGPLFRARLVRLADNASLLVLLMHQTTSDGPSLHLLFDELARGYAGESLPELEVQYGDYSEWLGGNGTERAELDWWREHLAGAPTTLALPADRPRPPVRGNRGGTFTGTMPEPVATGLFALAATLRTTPFAVALAGFTALLGTLAGVDDLLVGTPVGARDLPELEPLIGFFATTLPVRADLSGDPDFTELVRRTSGAVLDVIEHREVTFEELVAEVAPDRSPSHTPLVQAFFSFEPTPIVDARFPGLTATPVEIAPSEAKVDLDVMIVRATSGSGHFRTTFTYDPALFDAGTIRLLNERLNALLAAAVADPSIKIRDLPLLVEDERASVTGWSGAESPVPEAEPVELLITRQAARTPDAPAVRWEGGVLRYAELEARSAALARRLVDRGARPGVVVAVLLPRGPELVVALLAVLRSGAAWLPLDPAHPPARVATLIAQAGAELVVVPAEGLAAEWESIGGTRLVAVPVSAPEEGLAGDFPARTGDDPAYVVFTSGTTGRPKGVVVGRAALANHVHATTQRYRLGQDDVVLQFSSAVFDVLVEEVFPTLATGGCVVPRPEPAPAPAELTALLVDGGVTVVNLPAGYWRQWLATPGWRVPDSLRLAVVGSEPVDPAAARAWLAATDVPLVNAYGLTETTVTATAHTVTARDLTEPGAGVPVGAPLPGVRAHVLDRHGNPRPPGVPGELHVGGACLATGYLPADPDRFTTVAGERLLRTGDVARWRRDGALEVLGRADEQVKIRGHRVEPGEVEAVLRAHPDVLDAAVAAHPAPGGGHRLVGYLVPRNGNALPDGLRRHLVATLPAYLVPTALVVLDRLPVTAGGKLDRAALPAPQATAPGATPARTDLERALADVWRAALDVPEVGVHDNFFDLGGTSAALATVHARLADLVGRPVPLVALFEFPTVAALAASLGDGAGPAGAADPALADRELADRARVGRARLGNRRRTR